MYLDSWIFNFAEQDQKNNCVFTGRPVLVHEKEIRVERADVYILPGGGWHAKVFLRWTLFFALVYRAKLLWIPIIALGQQVDTVHGFTRACIVTPFLSKVRTGVIVNLTEETH